MDKVCAEPDTLSRPSHIFFVFTYIQEPIRLRFDTVITILQSNTTASEVTLRCLFRYKCRPKPYKRKTCSLFSALFFQLMNFCSMTGDLDCVLNLVGDSVYLTGDCNDLQFCWSVMFSLPFSLLPCLILQSQTSL